MANKAMTLTWKLKCSYFWVRSLGDIVFNLIASTYFGWYFHFRYASENSCVCQYHISDQYWKYCKEIYTPWSTNYWSIFLWSCISFHFLSNNMFDFFFLDGNVSLRLLLSLHLFDIFQFFDHNEPSKKWHGKQRNMH